MEQLEHSRELAHLMCAIGRDLGKRMRALITPMDQPLGRAVGNAVEVAECIASLDVIWRGNFIFGVGLGYREVEFDAFKVPKGQRLRRFEECLEIVKRLWTEDKVSVATDICTLSNVTLTCRPAQKPHPPIWFAANNDAAVRRAARLGDAWFVNPHATMASITRQMDLYR